MIQITLPDGSQREYPGPVTVAEVAASIGPGLAKAAIAGKVDGKVVDTSYTIDQGRPAADHHAPRTPRAWRSSAIRRRTCWPMRSRSSFPTRQGHDRPGDRERLLLRLLVQAAVHAGGPGGDREAHGASWPPRTSRSRAACCRATRRSQHFKAMRRALQGRDHRQHSRRAKTCRFTAKASSRTCAAARTCPARGKLSSSS